MKAVASRLLLTSALLLISVAPICGAEGDLARQATAKVSAKSAELANTPIRYTCRITQGIHKDADSTASHLLAPTASVVSVCTATLHGKKARYESVRLDTGERMTEVCDGTTRWVCRDPGNGQLPKESRGAMDKTAGRFTPWVGMVYLTRPLTDPAYEESASAGKSDLVEYTANGAGSDRRQTLLLDKTKDFAVTKRTNEWSGTWNGWEFGEFVSVKGIWLPTHAVYNHGMPPGVGTTVMVYDDTKYTVLSPEEAAKAFVIPAAAQ